MDQDSTKKVRPKVGILAFVKLMILWFWIQQQILKEQWFLGSRSNGEFKITMA
jgi:hypothetical protein